MTDGRWPPSTGAKGSAWGQSHLALDAIVAFVDEELSPAARRRAMAHLAGCPECAGEVVAQTQARLALRTGSAPAASSSLLSSLRAIPDLAELPAAPAGLAVAANGDLVTTGPLPPVRSRPRLDRRVRLGGAAAVSGLALGALMMTGSGGPAGGASPGAAQLSPGMADARMQRNAGVRDTGQSVPAARVVLAPGVSGVRKPAHQRWYR
jgi:anti-sigma factor RsiW